MFLGIDLGTSSLKVLLADQSGAIVDSISQEYPLYLPKENWSEQNPEDWWNALLHCFSVWKDKHHLQQVQGISFSGQMHGLVILDEYDQVIRPTILWNDNRTTKQCDYLNNKVGKQVLIEHTGNIALTGFTLPKLLWLKEQEPQHFKRIRKIMLPKDYLAYRMTGEFVTDVSDASGTLLLDVKNRCWSLKMLEIAEIKREQLPKLCESSTPIGVVLPKVCAAYHINEKAKVIIGGGDQAVGAIGTGTVSTNALSISLGTSGVVFGACEHFAAVTQGKLHSFCHANGKYHVMGVMLSAAGSLKWWQEQILKEQNLDMLIQESMHTQMDELLFLPYLMGERSPINDPHAKGMFHGLTLSHQRGNLTRAVLEGICFGLYDCYLQMKELHIENTSARVIGGGAKSDFWLQMLADILGLQLHTINSHDGGGLGAIILAMVGCGMFATVEEACKAIIRNEKTFDANPNQHSKYQEKFKRFKSMYLQTKESM